MDFTIGGLEIFMFICAGVALICSCIAPFFQKKGIFTAVFCIYSGVFSAAYFSLCTGMLNLLESDGDYGVPVDSITEGHAPYTTILMAIIFGFALIGFLLPVLTKFGKMAVHKNKIFNVYAIFSSVAFITIGISLFTSYSEYNNLFLFLPLHLAVPLCVSAITMHDYKIITQFSKTIVCTAVLVLVTVTEIVLMSSTVTALGIWLDAILIILAGLSVAALIFERIRETKSNNVTVLDK